MSYGRKIYLINPAFQLRFSIYVCFLICLVSAVYPWSIYELMNNIVVHFAVKNPDVATHYETKRNSLMLFLVSLHFALTLLSFVICIFFSHKVAGPLYKLTQHLLLIRKGDSPGKLWFRRGDYFKEIADEVNETVNYLESNYKKDLVYLSEVNTYIKNLTFSVPEDKQVVLNEISNRLVQIQDRYTSKQNG